MSELGGNKTTFRFQGWLFLEIFSFVFSLGALNVQWKEQLVSMQKLSSGFYASSRRKVQKLRDQSQYISKKVRALQYWRWACGTCCKQYHMLFYIQMAVVSTAIFFLFSPSFSFFLEIKVQIYIYFHNKCQYINQFPPKP